MTSRRLSLTAFFGLLAWAALWLVPLAVAPGPETLAARLLLLAPLVLVPLLLDSLARAGGESRALHAVSWALWPGALAVVASFLVPTGALAGAVAALWLVPTGLVALWGAAQLRRLWRRRTALADGWTSDAVLAVGALGLPGGAVWLVLSRAGIDPGPYGALVVLLTAVHFHFAAFVAPVWGGLLGRASLVAAPALTRAIGVCGLGLVAGTPLVAVGIALSGGPAGSAPIETLGVVVLTVSAIALGALGLAVAPRLNDRVAGLMLAVSAGSLVGAMGLSLWFNVGARLGWASPDLIWMLSRHGWLNGIGFGLWGALGWRRWSQSGARAPVAVTPEHTAGRPA